MALIAITTNEDEATIGYIEDYSIRDTREEVAARNGSTAKVGQAFVNPDTELEATFTANALSRPTITSTLTIASGRLAGSYKLTESAESGKKGEFAQYSIKGKVSV